MRLRLRTTVTPGATRYLERLSLPLMVDEDGDVCWGLSLRLGGFGVYWGKSEMSWVMNA